MKLKKNTILIMLLITTISSLFVVGCKNKENIVEEGKQTPSVNLIISSGSKYFEESEYVDEENNEDGSYKQTYRYEDVNFVLERMKHKDYSDFPTYIEDTQIYNLKYNDKSINEEIKTDLSYPVFKATYNTKIDDTEIFNEDILISTDDWDFRIHLDTPKNNYDKNPVIINDIINNLKVDEVD